MTWARWVGGRVDTWGGYLWWEYLDLGIWGGYLWTWVVELGWKGVSKVGGYGLSPSCQILPPLAPLSWLWPCLSRWLRAVGCGLVWRVALSPASSPATCASLLASLRPCP